jgi:hypothetical protein
VTFYETIKIIIAQFPKAGEKETACEKPCIGKIHLLPFIRAGIKGRRKEQAAKGKAQAPE